MKKMKKLFAALIASVVLVGTAAAVTPGDIFLNYGGGIEKGDSTASLSVALPWNMIGKGSGHLPVFVGEYEYALPLGPVPFTFGAYAGVTGWWTETHGAAVINAGGSMKYHMAIPPVPGLDLFIGTKLGLDISIGNIEDGDSYVGFDWGMDVGVSYWFNDTFGITGAVGYPSGRIGASFKF